MTARRKPKAASGRRLAPWWAALGERAPLTRSWLIVLLLLTLAVGATRLAALPGSLWHQDEAVFASAVLSFDITWSRPHPPWFPLWIVLGKAVHAVSHLSAGRSLQILSIAFSTATLIPLTLLWSLWLRRELAVAAALLYLFLPGVWMLSGRAFTDTPALALLVAALACWLDPKAGPRRTATGSLLAGLTILVRPQHVLLLAGPLIASWYRRGDRRALLVPLTACLAVGGAGLLIAGGPPRLLWKALKLQAAYQNTHGITASHAFAQLGPARALLLPTLGMIWTILAMVGAVLLWRARLPARGALLIATCLPTAALVLFFVDGTIIRYWLPFLALSSGLVLAAVAAALRRFSLPVAAVAIAASAWAVVPALESFRTEVSPPLLGLARAERLAQSRGWTVVADLNIRPFAEYRRLQGRLARRVVYDVELGRNKGVPPPWSVVALYTDDQDRFIVEGGPPEVFHARTPLLERLLSGPYLTTTVVPAARVRPARRRTPNQPRER